MSRQGAGFTVLIADDEPEVIDLVRLILDWEGYKVVAAADGREALDRIRAERPDLILLDVRMPKLSGLAVLDQMAKAGNGGIPVIMLSVVTTYPEVRKALQGGALAYLPKPFELKEMTRLVGEILGMDAAQRQELRQRALEKLDRGW